MCTFLIAFFVVIYNYYYALANNYDINVDVNYKKENKQAKMILKLCASINNDQLIMEKSDICMIYMMKSTKKTICLSFNIGLGNLFNFIFLRAFDTE